MKDESPIDKEMVNDHNIDSEDKYTNCLVLEKKDSNKKTNLILDNKYKVIDKIIKNTSNKIVLAMDMINNRKYAIKMILTKNYNIGLSFLEKQALYMQKCKGDNIIDFIELKMNGKKKKSTYPVAKSCHYIVLEYAPRGELYNFIKLNNGIYYKVARYYFKQLINGVESIHKLNTCHRDIKIDNLLLDENFNLKISDFEFCQDIKGPDDELIIHLDKLGTLSYMAPEFFTPRIHPTTKSYKIFHTGDKVDIFACGVVLFILLTGFFPFSSAEKYDTQFKHFYENNHATFWNGKKIKIVSTNIPESAKDLINKMLEPNPDKRITLPEIKKHEFFNEVLPDDDEVYDYMNNIWLMLERKFKKKDFYQ